MKETLEFVEDKNKKRKIKELLQEGYTAKCLGCGGVYKNVPTELYEDGHGGRPLGMCRCGSDLFTPLKEVSCEIPTIKPVDGKIVLKEHNFKHCKCEKGEVWTGDAETECFKEWNFIKIKETKNKKHYRCPLSKFEIVILKSSKEEMDNAGYIRFIE